MGYEVAKLILTYETIGLVTYILITHILVPVLILMKILFIAHLSLFLPDILLENHPLLLFGCFLFQKLPLLVLLVPQVLLEILLPCLNFLALELLVLAVREHAIAETVSWTFLGKVLITICRLKLVCLLWEVLVRVWMVQCLGRQRIETVWLGHERVVLDWAISLV